MKNWRFLIQQEGDRDWLPLESPESEILEGRYRLVGRSQQHNYPVQICLTYRDLDTPEPPRRHRRAAQTNDQGLVAIFPFTRLQPGLWEIACDIGEISVAVHLHVVPHDGSPELESEPDLLGLAPSHGAADPNPRGDDAPPSQRRAAAAPGDNSARNGGDRAVKTDAVSEFPEPPASDMVSVADLFQTVEEMADQVISAMAARMSGEQASPLAAAEPPRSSPPLPSSPLASQPSPSEPPLTLTAPATIELQPSAYTFRCNAQAAGYLTLAGRITEVDLTHLPATLTLVLITPHTGETLIKRIYPTEITHSFQSFDWSIPVSLPHDTHLLLARLSLRSSAASNPPWSLADCSFAVMVLSQQTELTNPFTFVAPQSANPSPLHTSNNPVPAGGDRSRRGSVDLPPFLSNAPIPPQTRAAALSKVAELSQGDAQERPVPPPGTEDVLNEAINPFQYPVDDAPED